MAHERGGPATRAGALVAGLLAGPLGDDLGEAQRAARAWYAANGDRERAHTTGVWLRKPPRAGADPVMVVRVDSGLLASELGTNKDLYLSRLSFHGVRVSDIRFDVGQMPAAASRPPRPRQVPEKAAHPQRELSPGERERVERACAQLPDGLRQSVSRAMCASLLKEKSHTTQED